MTAAPEPGTSPGPSAPAAAWRFSGTVPWYCQSIRWDSAARHGSPNLPSAKSRRPGSRRGQRTASRHSDPVPEPDRPGRFDLRSHDGAQLLLRHRGPHPVEGLHLVRVPVRRSRRAHLGDPAQPRAYVRALAGRFLRRVEDLPHRRRPHGVQYLVRQRGIQQQPDVPPRRMLLGRGEGKHRGPVSPQPRTGTQRPGEPAEPEVVPVVAVVDRACWPSFPSWGTDTLRRERCPFSWSLSSLRP